MDRDLILILCVVYIAFILISGVIYDAMYWWDKYKYRYVYTAMLFWLPVFILLPIYYLLMYIYNKFYKIKW